MAYHRTAIVSAIIVISLLGGYSLSQADDEPGDTVFSDTSAVNDTLPLIDDDIYFKADSLELLLSDTTAIDESIRLPAPEYRAPYYKSYISSKSLGDYLRYKPGIFSLQHGAVGQPEMLVKSVMLPGLNALYKGIPVFHQGTYFPFRSGPDLNALMFEDVSTIDITPLSYLGLFSQGEVLSLNSMIWPPENNPSSITIARGPFGYDRAGWRFSRRFSENVGASFALGFKESDGYYSTGADYDAYSIAGSAVWRPKPNAEIQYSLYQHEAKQGVLQFDRVLPPTQRSNHDINFHLLKFIFKSSENLAFDLDLFHQKNYNHVFDNQQGYHYRVRDYIWGGKSAAYLSLAGHNLKFQIGGRRHYFSNRGVSQGLSVTMGLVLSDSIKIGQSQSLVLAARTRHNNIEKYDLAGTARFNWQVNDKVNLGFSGGRLAGDPDIYALKFQHPVVTPIEQDVVSSYFYQPNGELGTKKSYFGEVETVVKLSNWLAAGSGLSVERVTDDIIPVFTRTGGDWISTHRNVNYDRLTFTLMLDYTISKYFRGSSGLTYFLYDPNELLAGIDYTPSILAHSFGEFKVEQVLWEVDLSGAFQCRYISRRDYLGFISIETENYSFDPVIVLDGSLAIRFGAFEFRLTEDNILDYLDNNDYSIWGSYFMPPGNVWWTFTWNFEN